MFWRKCPPTLHLAILGAPFRCNIWRQWLTLSKIEINFRWFSSCNVYHLKPSAKREIFWILEVGLVCLKIQAILHWKITNVRWTYMFLPRCTVRRSKLWWSFGGQWVSSPVTYMHVEATWRCAIFKVLDIKCSFYSVILSDIIGFREI